MAGMNTDTELLVNAIMHQSTMAADSVGLKLSAAELLFVFESIGQAFVKERVTNGNVSLSIVVLDYIRRQARSLPDQVVKGVNDAMPDTIMGHPVKVIDADKWPESELIFGDWGLYSGTE